MANARMWPQYCLVRCNVSLTTERIYVLFKLKHTLFEIFETVKYFVLWLCMFWVMMIITQAVDEMLSAFKHCTFLTEISERLDHCCTWLLLHWRTNFTTTFQKPLQRWHHIQALATIAPGNTWFVEERLDKISKKNKSWFIPRLTK